MQQWDVTQMQCNHKKQLQRPQRQRLQQHRWLLWWRFKLVRPSQGDQGGQNKTKAHYTISAVDSCPEVAVYAGKCLAVSLIHLQAYKLMPDTLKTAITLPGELETLTTANGSPMHIIRHATITLHLKNLRVTHHFIVVESLMTDVILGIDFQREYWISYDWDEGTWYRKDILCTIPPSN